MQQIILGSQRRTPPRFARAGISTARVLWVDDFWGTAAWNRWSSEIGRVLPSGEFPIVDIPLAHPLLHTLYDVPAFLQVSSINFWSRTGGSVSERGYDSAEVHPPRTSP